jgi:hypothetical protein
MSNNFFVGPTPPYNNPPTEPQYFLPSAFVISGVTLGQTTIVTTTENVNYVIGQLARLLIPFSFGCTQLNEVTGYVLSIPNPNQVQLAIDSSRNVDPYVASNAKTQAQIVPVGDINTGIVNPNGRTMQTTFIPGSFINISPN